MVSIKSKGVVAISMLKAAVAVIAAVSGCRTSLTASAKTSLSQLSKQGPVTRGWRVLGVRQIGRACLHNKALLCRRR